MHSLFIYFESAGSLVLRRLPISWRVPLAKETYNAVHCYFCLKSWSRRNFLGGLICSFCCWETRCIGFHSLSSVSSLFVCFVSCFELESLSTRTTEKESYIKKEIGEEKKMDRKNIPVSAAARREQNRN